MTVGQTRIAVVGATGLVGGEFRRLLEKEPYSKKNFEVLYFASRARPAEKVLALEDSWDQLATCQVVLNATEADVAVALRERLKDDQVLIDNSSAFRLDVEVPLVVPEVNLDQLDARPQVIANPNCTAILLCVALNAFRDNELKRVVVATYQAASGAGLKGLEELREQSQALVKGETPRKGEVFPFPLAGNVMSHNTSVRAEDVIGGGYNGEEWKVIQETRKIMGVGHLLLSVTCMRVPVERSHTEAVTVDLRDEWSLLQIREAFAKAPGVKVVDDWKENHFPMPLESQMQNDVLVGRIRKDASLGKTVHFILSGDQLLKGAASNALQIMDRVLELRESAG